MSQLQQHDTNVVGLKPLLPRPLSNWSWFTRPVRAELYALLRILMASVLLLDLCFTMLPQLSFLYGMDSTGDPRLFGWMFDGPQMHWSLLEGIYDPATIRLAFMVWMAAAIGLLVGWHTRLCAILVWVFSISFTNLNLYAINAGDHIRGMLLLYLMLVPCGAVWSVDAWLRSGRGDNASRRVHAHPWALRLILIQLAWMYCASGICKASGNNWVQGDSLYYVLNDISLTRFSPEQVSLPLWMTQMMTWSVLAWEISFPLLLCFRWTRVWALWFGVAMHLGIFISMEIGCFPLYLLAAYAPLLVDHWYMRQEAKHKDQPEADGVMETSPSLAL